MQDDGPGSTGVALSDQRPAVGSVEEKSQDSSRVHRAPEFAVLLLSCAVFFWHLSAPSPWWDEAVSRYAVGLSFADLGRLAGTIDLVHFAYYLIGHSLFLLLGSPTGSDHIVTALRVLSALVSVGTAITLVQLGRSLGSWSTGLAAGAVFAVSPMASRYAQEARPYALVTFAATVSTLILIRTVNERGGHRHWLFYAISVAGMGLLNEISLSLLPVHFFVAWRYGAGLERRRWATAAGSGVLVLVPFLVATSRQDAQISWLTKPDLAHFERFFELQWGNQWLPAIFVALGLVVWLWRSPRQGRLPRAERGSTQADRASGAPHSGRAFGSAPDGGALVLGILWALLPPVLLWFLSQIHPLFVPRYLVFTLPGAALALGSLTAVLGPVICLAMVVVLAGTGLSTQSLYRDPVRGHGEDIRSVASLVGRDSTAGDAVVFLPTNRRIVARAYPEYFSRVDDVALDPSTSPVTDLYGREVKNPGVLEARMHNRGRVWVISSVRRMGDTLTLVDEQKKQLIGAGYVSVESISTAGYTAALYVIRKAGSDTPVTGHRVTVQNCPFCP